MHLLTWYLLPLVLLTAIVLLLGLLPLRQRARDAAVAMELGAHAASWAVVLVSATIWISRAGKMFQDFGIESSNLSALVIQMAQPLVMLIVCAIVLAVDGIVYSSLWRNDVSQTVRNRFSLFMTLVPLLIMLVFGTTIYLPLLKLLG
jgi:hypothetical protein